MAMPASAAGARCARWPASRWTSCSPSPASARGRQSYVAMRALRDRDAFLPTDLGVKHALRGSATGDPTALAERWRPYRAYAVLQLWSAG